MTGESEEERRARLQRRQKNRRSFDKYLKKSMADRLSQALNMAADVVDTAPFNPHTYRPSFNRLGTTAALVALGVEESTACDMVAGVGDFPATRVDLQKKFCRA